MKYLLFLILSIILNASSYIFYKYSSINSTNRLLSYSLLALGLALGAVNAFFYTKSLKGINLNIAYPIFSALSIILISIFSISIFKESLSAQKIIGIVIIIIGVVIISIK